MAHEKLKEALHYVISHCDDPARLGAIRLNKIMWFADCYAYRLNGASITADSYVKRKFGPVPRHVLAALRELQSDGKIAARETPYYNGTMRQFFSMQAVEHERLSEQDRDILASYSDIICKNYSANEISNISHDQIWEAADDGEEIPLYATFAANRGEITAEVRDWATEAAKSFAH